MSANQHLNDDQLTLLYFDEASLAEHSHLATCGNCQERLQLLAQFLNAVQAAPTPQRPDEWEDKLWAAIGPRIRETLLNSPRRRWFRPWLLAPALTALLALVFIAGMYTQHHIAPIPEASPKARERVLLIALGDHFDRSQIVLAELLNSPSGKSIDISGQQQLAERLLPENRLLRQTALRSGDPADANVLEQLERVLLEIAHSPTEIPSSELAALQQRIESQGLLFKVRIISANAREKGKTL